MIRCSAWGGAAGIAAALSMLAACGGPHLESKTVSTRTYTSQTSCGQDLVSTEFEARGAKWGESIIVSACGTREIAGYVEVDADLESGGRIAWNGSFGNRSENSRCVVRDAESAVVAEGSGRSTQSGNAGNEPAGEAAATAPATQAPKAFREVQWTGDVCLHTMRTVMALPKLRRGSAIRVRVWSEEPNDLRGAVLRLAHAIEVPNVSEAEWERHLAKKEAKREKRERERERSPKASEAELRRRLAEAEAWQEYEEERARRPSRPPPQSRGETPPPRPSVNAEWVPGYWHWADKDWAWIGGQWRVPGADVRDGLTVRAPHAPPALRAETRPARPARDMVWMPGYWQWNGSTFIWVPGTWVLAPRRDSAWRAPSWRAVDGGVVFVPGGWLLR